LDAIDGTHRRRSARSLSRSRMAITDLNPRSGFRSGPTGGLRPWNARRRRLTRIARRSPTRRRPSAAREFVFSARRTSCASTTSCEIEAVPRPRARSTCAC